MKKILMLLWGLLIILTIPKVEAQTYKLTKIDQKGIYFVRTGGTIPDKNGTFAIYYLDGSIAYCVEPSKSIRTEDYVAHDGFVDLPYSDAVKEKIELYGYYGREYPGHDNVRYSMAAQSLIWEITGGQTVTFWTEKNGGGDRIDVSKEKNEILSLVEKHHILPNLPSKVYTDISKEVVVEDKNNALNNFMTINTSLVESWIENNKLHIIPKDKGVFNVQLKRKKYDNLNTVIFVGANNSDTQSLGRLRFSGLDEQEITVSSEGVHISLQKTDENNNPINISGVRFKIKNLNNDEYLCDNSNCEYQTDANGHFTTNGVSFGEYQIEEVENQLIKGYYWNNEKKVININENNIAWNKDRGSYYDTTFKNYSVSVNLQLYKKAEKSIINNNEISYITEELGNVYFDLYDNNNHFIKTIITDSHGYAMVDGLKIGKYYLVEKTPFDDYIEMGKIGIEFKQYDQYEKIVNHSLTVTNVLKKGKLEFRKKDLDTNVGIPNTTIGIYNEKNELLLTKKTDNYGRVIVNNLPVGKYYIKELEANYSYQKTDEVVEFQIIKNGETVRKEMTNRKITGNLIITKYGEVLSVKDNTINYIMQEIPNIEFNLFNDNNELITVLKTNQDGVIKKELPLGIYYLEEKTKLPNYKDNSERYTIEIKKDNDSGIDVRLNINNYLKKGGVEFSKEELISKFGISNTIMELFDENDELIMTGKTNDDGKIIINNLPLGKYYLKEKEANYFFQSTDDLVPFEIKEDGEVIRTYLTNEKIVGNLEIFKKGENYHFVNNEIQYEEIKLHNIEFDLYQDGNLIDHIITNQNGYAKYNNLPLGKYYLIETTNLDNYVKDEQKHYFEIKKNGNVGIDAKVEINNYLKKGKLEFIKKDINTDVGIPNTIIEIYKDNKLVLTKETDENGKVIIENLPLGKYYIQEKKANELYQLTNEKVYFEIRDNNELVSTNMTNEKIVIPVPKTNTNERVIAYSLFGISFLIGLGRFYYEKKSFV